MKPKDACFSILNLRVHPQVQTSVPVTQLITGYTLTQLITGYRYRPHCLTQLITGYEGPVTAAHIACLQLTAAQIMQLDLTGEQKVKLSPYQDAVVSSIIPSPYKACDETVPLLNKLVLIQNSY